VYSAARDAASATVRRFPESAEVWQLLGDTQFKLGRYRDAVTAYEHAVQLNPASADLQVGLATSLWSDGQKKEAGAAFERVIRQFPLHAAAYDAYGTFLMETATNKEGTAMAAALLHKALALDDRRFEPHYQLGNQVLKKDPAGVSPAELKEALRQLEQAAALAPDNRKVHYALARVLRLIGREQDARREMEKLLRLESQEKNSSTAGDRVP
jgi:cytochrome c-type biogenesis protein CcmH/NrfG